MKPILLATDGSPCAEAATQEAIDLAHVSDAPLIVVAVARAVLPVYAGFYGYGEITTDLHKVEDERVTRLLAETKERASAAGVPCSTVGLDGFDGLAGEQICRAARERSPRLIVVGAHGWGRVGRLLHGSVSTYVLHHAGCPVLVVHGDERTPVDGRVATAVAAVS